jgi:UDP-4-amino-4,6-dideoxy-N-acetyl-beta-L-altrosamine transaminase
VAVVGRKEAALAVHGGQPVRKTLLPYGHQNVDEDDIRAVVEVLRSDWITTGPKVAEFEEAFAEYVGARYAVSFSSGTAALHGAAFAAGLGPGDEAITTPLTFCATANCVLYQGASPVFADVCSDTLNLDADAVARRITSHTKAILPVDYAGHPADLDPLLELADRHGLVVIEDACHALGAEYKGRRVGSISHMTVFSFHPVKHITTGEGGMVTTDDAELARRLRMFRNHGIDSDARQRQAQGQWYYEMLTLGYNYRLTDIGCALGLSQLRRLDANLARRREIAARYNASFHDIRAVILPAVRPNVNPAWHLYPIRLDLPKLRVGRAEIFRALRAENIGVNVHYIPVHLHPYYRERFGYQGGECPGAERAYEQLVSLPMFHGMTDQDIEDVIRAVRKVLEYYARHE